MKSKLLKRTVEIYEGGEDLALDEEALEGADEGDEEKEEAANDDAAEPRPRRSRK